MSREERRGCGARLVQHMNDDELRRRLDRLEGSLPAAFRRPAGHERHRGRLAAFATSVVVVVIAVVGTMWTISAVARPSGASPEGLALASADADSPVSEGCEPATTPPDDPDFASVEMRLGPAQEGPEGRLVTDFGVPVDNLNEVPPPADVLALGPIPGVLAYDTTLYDVTDAAPRWTVVTYLSPQPVTGTIVDVMAARAVQIVQKEANGQDAQLVADTLDEGNQPYSIIRIGEFDALVHHADPVGTDDVRPWHIYWSDGIRDWSVVGNRDPVDLIDLARSIYCGT
jgi:hypothetical protein